MTTRSLMAAARRASTHQEARFLVAGAWNTLFGYLAFLAVYAVLYPGLGTTWILCISYAIAVTQSFVVQRFWVFRTRGPVSREFPRFVAANSLVFGANLAFLPLAISASDVPPPILQAGFVALSTIASYFLHKHFSFAQKP